MQHALEITIKFWPLFMIGGTAIVVWRVTVSRAYEKAKINPYLNIEEDGRYKSVSEAYIKTQKKIEQDYMLRDSHRTISKDEEGFHLRVDYGTKGYEFISEEEK